MPVRGQPGGIVPRRRAPPRSGGRGAPKRPCGRWRSGRRRWDRNLFVAATLANPAELDRRRGEYGRAAVRVADDLHHGEGLGRRIRWCGDSGELSGGAAVGDWGWGRIGGYASIGGCGYDRDMANVQAKFEEAQAKINGLAERPDNDTALRLYALYKQAKEGDATGERPGMMDFVRRAKWDAWALLKGVSSADAMKGYIDLAAELTKKK